MFKHFTKHLKSVRYPKKQETWYVSGILGNERYNFDIRKLDEPLEIYELQTKSY